MKQAKWLSLGAVAILFCAFSGLAYGGVVLSENFNALTPSLDVTSAGAFSTIGGTNVDIVGGGLFGALCASPEGGNCIDLDGSGGNPEGQLQSNMLFSAGTYLLSYDLIGSGRGSTASATVTFGSYIQSFTLTAGDNTSGIVVDQSVTLTSPGYLEFASNTPGDIGLVLDNVVVSTPATTTPEPASYLPLGCGMFAGMLVIWRRRHSASRAA